MYEIKIVCLQKSSNGTKFITFTKFFTDTFNIEPPPKTAKKKIPP